MQINVSVTDANNIVCEVVPPQPQVIVIDRGVEGNGIVSIVPVTISTFQYLRITYTNGTVQDVGPLTSTAYTATSPITIVGNTISLATVPIASGGTDATTAAGAIQNLLPSYTGNANKRLGLNSGGTALEWVADGGGTVTSINASGGTTGLTFSGGPITSSGTLTLSGTLAIANGGTGQITANAAFNALVPSQTGNAGKYLTTDGTDTSWATNPLGTVTSVAATVPSFLSVTGSPITTSGTLAITYSGTALPIANGGTGQTTANAALNALLPTQTGNASKYLQTDGTNATWDAISLSTADITGILGVPNGGTGLSTLTAGYIPFGAGTSAFGSSSNLFWDNTNTRLGVGTASPDSVITFAGNITSKGNDNYGIGTNGGNNHFNVFATGASGAVRFWTNGSSATAVGGGGSERARIDSAGNFGIGTNSPTKKLDIRGTNAGELALIQINNDSISGAPTIATMEFACLGSAKASIAAAVYADGYMAFRTNNNTEKARITASGELLIGRTSSSGLGQIQSTIGADLATDSGSVYLVRGGGNVGIGTSSPATKLQVTSAAPAIRIQETTTGGDKRLELGVTSGGQAYIGANQSAQSLQFQTVGSTQMTLNANGRLLVGYANDTYLSSAVFKGLFVNGGANASVGVAGGSYTVANYGQLYLSGGYGDGGSRTSGFYIRSQASGGGGNVVNDLVFVAETANGSSEVEYARFNSAGNFGLGTSSPDAKLQVVGQSFFGADGAYAAVGSPKIVIYGSAATETSSFWFQAGVGSALAGFVANDSNFYITNTYAGNALGSNGIAINQSGSVGIGATSPVAKLDVYQATAGSNAARFAHVNGNGIYLNPSYNYYDAYNHIFRSLNGTTTYATIDNNGNLGIGTTSPSEALEISRTTDPKIRFVDVGNLDAKIGIVSSTALGFEVNGSERARITSSGRFLIGTTDSGGNKLAISDGAGDTSSYGSVQVVRAASSGTSWHYAGIANGADICGFGFNSSNTAIFGQGNNPNTPNAYVAAGTIGGSNNLVFGTSGTERARINSSGSLGINTSAPAGRLQVNELSGSPLLYVNGTTYSYDSSSSIILTESNTSAQTGINSLMLANNTYSVGAFSPILSFTSRSSSGSYNNVYAGIYGVMTGQGVDTNWVTGDLVLATGTGAGITERARLTSGGALYMSRVITNPYDTNIWVECNISSWLIVNNHTFSTQYFNVFRYNGTSIGSIIGNGTSTTYATSSDYRLKENIAPMTGALAKVAQLKPCTYTWKSNGSSGEGFIAHELAEVMPQAVTGEKDAVDENGNPDYQGIDTSFLVATLTAAIQELKAEFDAYKASHP
jgi:hypothetical protein